MQILFLTLVFALSLFAKVDIYLSHTKVKHGTTFAVVFQSDTKMVQAPNVQFLNKTYQMFTINGDTTKYELFIPVDYYTKKEKKSLNIKYIKNHQIKQKKLFVTIVDGAYQKNEIIKVPKAKVTLSTTNKQRAKKEYAKVYKNVYSKISLYDLTHNQPFENPMQSKITSAFGNARIYNHKTRSYHSGVDFRAKVGTPIYASNSGVVALVMDRFYLGRVVYIDHGRGAYSYYAHMDKALLKQNQKVKKGELIGYSGKTGRVTGAHLHYALRLYNTTVDPLQYHQVYNQILKKYH